MQLSNILKFVLLGLAGLSFAHPGGHDKSSLTPAAKKTFLHNAKRSLGQCADHLERRNLNARAAARRTAIT